MTRFGKVNADLVGSTGQRPRFDQRGFRTRLHHAKPRLRFLAVPRVHFYSPDFFRIRREFQSANPFLPPGNSPHHTQVSLLHTP